MSSGSALDGEQTASGLAKDLTRGCQCNSTYPCAFLVPAQGRAGKGRAGLAGYMFILPAFLLLLTSHTLPSTWYQVDVQCAASSMRRRHERPDRTWLACLLACPWKPGPCGGAGALGGVDGAVLARYRDRSYLVLALGGYHGLMRVCPRARPP